MALTRYEPWGLLNQLHRELERGTTAEGSAATAQWAPAVDIKEEADKFLIQADIPGVKPDEIEISMEDGVLTISGERKTEAETKNDNYKRVERTFGSFYRRFSLPDTANADAISAVSKQGVLGITIPKREAVQPRKISVVAEG